MASVSLEPREVRWNVGGYELRAVDSADKFLECVVTTYNDWKDVGAFEERMMPGVFDGTLSRHSDSVKLVVGHDDSVPAVATPTEWRKADDHLSAVFRFGTTEECRKAHQQAAEGLFGGVSVGFLPGRKEGDSLWEMHDSVPRVTRHHARLLHVGLVTVPANADSLFAVRSVGVPEEVFKATPNLDEARRVLEWLREKKVVLHR
jgi:HK97 family phage prohead protease